MSNQQKQDQPQRPLLLTASFLRLLGVGSLNGTGRWLDMLVIAIFVFDQTSSPFLVASMLMLRLLPMALFGLFGGALAQRLPGWLILRGAATLSVSTAAALCLLAYHDMLAVWHVGTAAFLSGVVWTTDFPVRRALMSEIAGPARVSRAMSLDILAGASTRTLGPIMGGLLYAEVGTTGAFALSALIYGCGLLLVIAPGRENARSEAQTSQPILANLAAGWNALRADQTLQGILAVTLIFNLWGFPFISMVPVFAKDIFLLDDATTGLFSALEGGGALLGAIALSFLARGEHSRYLYSGGVFLYCVCALLFSLSGNAWLAAALLLALGIVSAAFGAMQSALIIMNAPDGMERQMMGILSVFIGSAPLGFLQIGLLSDLFGVRTACLVVAILGLTTMLLALWRWPQLRSLQPIKSA